MQSWWVTREGARRDSPLDRNPFQVFHVTNSSDSEVTTRRPRRSRSSTGIAEIAQPPVIARIPEVNPALPALGDYGEIAADVDVSADLSQVSAFNQATDSFASTTVERATVAGTSADQPEYVSRNSNKWKNLVFQMGGTVAAIALLIVALMTLSNGGSDGKRSEPGEVTPWPSSTHIADASESSDTQVVTGDSATSFEFDLPGDDSLDEAIVASQLDDLEPDDTDATSNIETASVANESGFGQLSESRVASNSVDDSFSPPSTGSLSTSSAGRLAHDSHNDGIGESWSLTPNVTAESGYGPAGDAWSLGGNVSASTNSPVMPGSSFGQDGFAQRTGVHEARSPVTNANDGYSHARVTPDERDTVDRVGYPTTYRTGAPSTVHSRVQTGVPAYPTTSAPSYPPTGLAPSDQFSRQLPGRARRPAPEAQQGRFGAYPQGQAYSQRSGQSYPQTSSGNNGQLYPSTAPGARNVRPMGYDSQRSARFQNQNGSQYQ